MRTLPVIAALSCLLTTFGCGSTNARQVRAAMDGGLLAAQQHVEAGRQLEAYQLTHAMHGVDPDHPGLAELESQLEGAAGTFQRPILGINRPRRYRDPDAGIGSRIGWYLPDRILDVLDVFSFDVHSGLGAYVGVHGTGFLSFAAGGRAIGGIGWHEHRSLGVQAKAEGGLSVLMFDGHGRVVTRAGTSGVDAWGGGHGGLLTPGDGYFQEFMDFWAVGASVTAGVIGVEADVHLLEVCDAVLGFLFIDFLGDDFATTNGLEMSDREWGYVRTLAAAAGDEELRLAYEEMPADSAAPEATGQP